MIRLPSRRPRAGDIVDLWPRKTWLSPDEIVTGERLQSLAEVSIVPRHIHDFHQHVDRYARDLLLVDSYEDLDDADLERLSSARSHFVYTHALPEYIEHVWPRLAGDGYVLVTHNSDHEIDAGFLPWIEGTGGKLARWFAQNAQIEHPKLEQLPIAIANSMWAHGNVRTLHRAIARAADRPKTELVFLHFNRATYPPREEVWETLRRAFPDAPEHPPPARDFRSYLNDLARYRFCVCPRGNGVDTHRVWECLYLGVIPIVERSPNVTYWERAGAPLLVVDDWAEVTPERLERGREGHAFDDRARDLLRLSHYRRAISTPRQPVERLGTA